MPSYKQKKSSSINDGAYSKDAILLHRQVFILAGEERWQKEILKTFLSENEGEQLWVGETALNNISCVDAKKARSWLGNEKRVVIFDANKNIDPDSFAAISGVVVGGGLFFLLLPEKDNWNNVYTSHFGQRFIESIISRSELTVVTPDSKKIDFSYSKLEGNNFPACTPPFLTKDQQISVESIEKQIIDKTHNPVVLISDRGRGKSAALGITIAKLMQQGINKIAITAPRLRATEIVFKHITSLLPEAIVTRGCIQYGESIAQFYSPDQLLLEKITADVLMIDEAAAIPVPILTSFLHDYSHCVFATTVHGYEGTGRGFSLRFVKELDEKYPHWIKLNMKAPVRWAENDPLEKWMFDLLCLDADILDETEIKTLCSNGLEHCLLKKEQFVNNESLLKEVFSLLVLAHYRTRPKDLESLLDDENIFLYVTFNNKHVVAVALVIHEGSFSGSLSSSVYRGERRPQGHLLAQSLTYHCGIENAATLNYVRVMRIAVHPHLQEQGIGTELLDFIIKNEKNNGRDAIGTSFGMNVRLLSFWNKLNFNIMRIGFTREKSSGEHAAIMLLGLNSSGCKMQQQINSHFNEQIPYLLEDILGDLPKDIKNKFQYEKAVSSELSELDNKELNSFVHYSRNYELCISSLKKFVSINHKELIKDDFPEKFRLVINQKVIDNLSWKTIVNNMGLIGQQDARRLFCQAIMDLMSRL